MDKLLTPKRELEVVGGIVGGMTFLSTRTPSSRNISFSCSERKAVAGGEWGEAGWGVLAWW